MQRTIRKDFFSIQCQLTKIFLTAQLALLKLLARFQPHHALILSTSLLISCLQQKEPLSEVMIRDPFVTSNNLSKYLSTYLVHDLAFPLQFLKLVRCRKFESHSCQLFSCTIDINICTVFGIIKQILMEVVGHDLTMIHQLPHCRV